MTGKGTFIITDKKYYPGEINNEIFNGKARLNGLMELNIMEILLIHLYQEKEKCLK